MSGRLVESLQDASKVSRGELGEPSGRLVRSLQETVGGSAVEEKLC